MANLLGSGGITLSITGEWSLATHISNTLSQPNYQTGSKATNPLVGVDAIVMPAVAMTLKLPTFCPQTELNCLQILIN